jgi:hypothetical protein
MNTPFNYKRDTKSSRPVNEYIPQGYDACQTPAYAVSPVLPWLTFGWTIWEPAAGEGNLVEAIRAYDYNVVGTDILTGQNFFTHNFLRWDAIVTNPPFSLKYKWMARCYQLDKPFALLLPVETLGAKTAQAMFGEFGVEVIFLNRRVNFKMPNAGWSGKGAQFPVCWITWGLGIGKQMSFVNLEVK